MVARIALWPFIRVLGAARRNGWWPELKLLLKNRLFPIGPINPHAQDPPPIFRMASAYWLSQAIYVAAKLGIADLLKDGPQSYAALATVSGTNAASLFRLLRALSSVSIFSQVGEDHFALTQLAYSLRSGVPGSLRAMVISLGEIHYQACGDLLHSVKTGSPSFNKTFGRALFDYLEQDSEAAEAFHQGMTNLTSLVAHAVLMAYDFSGLSSIVDVGGGEGELLRRILGLNPELKGVVFDLPKIIGTAKEVVDHDRIGKRLSYAAGDFFESVPDGADTYILCNVLHDWDNDRAARVLWNCRRAMAQNGRVLLIEMIVPERNGPSFSKLLDLNMLVMTGGRERTKGEFAALLNDAGYKLTRIIPTMAPQSIIEAQPHFR